MPFIHFVHNLAYIFKKDVKYFSIFVLIGAFCVFIDYFFYLIFLKLFHLWVDLSKLSSSVISVSSSYFINGLFNFGQNHRISSSSLFKFLLLYLPLILVNILLNKIFLQLFAEINQAFWCAAIFSVVINYITVKLFFRSR